MIFLVLVLIYFLHYLILGFEMRCVICKRKLERTVCRKCEKDLAVVKNKAQLIKFLEKKVEEDERENSQ